MLQVLNQQAEEKLKLRNTANDENEFLRKMLYSDSNKGELFSDTCIEKIDIREFYLSKEATAETKEVET